MYFLFQSGQNKIDEDQAPSGFRSLYYILMETIQRTIQFFKSGVCVCEGGLSCFKNMLSISISFLSHPITYTNILYEQSMYTANMCSEITVRTQLKTVKLNYSFFTVIWPSILPYIVQCRSVYSSLQLLHCTWSSNQM